MSGVVIVILASIAIAVIGQLLLKIAMNQTGAVAWNAPLRWRRGGPYLVGGMAMYLISMALWLFALTRVELSFAFPFVSLSYLGIVFAAWVGLGEALSQTRILGSVLIMIGVFIVAMSR